jgi:hypothetical protein
VVLNEYFFGDIRWGYHENGNVRASNEPGGYAPHEEPSHKGVPMAPGYEHLDPSPLSEVKELVGRLPLQDLWADRATLRHREASHQAPEAVFHLLLILLPPLLRDVR